jgi:chromate reductase, NAD(P)H dehydrogenase (quinone)
MNAKFKVAVLVGSLRSGSFTRRVAQALIKGAPSSLQCRLVEVGDLPLYNEDREGSVDSWSRFRSDIAGSDAALLLTPEYNRSIPACLKNAIDVGSRPQGKNLWDGKPAAVVSVTP